jgi:large subunit ribosomal protein L25
VSETTRPKLAAEHREIVGKKVATLRRAGKLPAVVYGHGHDSQPIQLDAHEFDILRRHAGRNALVDLKVGSSRAFPVLLHAVHEHPVSRRALHADFFVVKMSEEMAVDVPVALVGESEAVVKQGGTLLHLRDTIHIRALPADIPPSLELDVTSLLDFDAVLHVSDLVVPSTVTVLTDASEPVARVQPPRLELEPVLAEEAEAEEGEEGAEPGEPAEEGAEGTPSEDESSS